MNVAIPSIVDELAITSTQVQWVQESYTLVFAALLLVFGTLADRFGRRRMLLLGVALFAASSVVAALAPSGDALILARVVQGLGGAMILPATLSLLNATFTGRERGIAFAVWGSTIGGMAAVGPLLGGWLTTDFSWRWAFGINLPLGILIVIGTLLVVRESRADVRARVDVVGAALSVVLFTSLVFALIEGRSYGWWETGRGAPEFWTFDISPIPFALAITVLSLLAFIAWGVHRERRGASTMIAFGLFRLASFRNGNIAALIVALGEFGIILSLPLWLQNVLNYDALQTGVVLLALAGGSFLASGFGRRQFRAGSRRLGGAGGDRGRDRRHRDHRPRDRGRYSLVADCAGPGHLRLRGGACDRPAHGCRARGCSDHPERAGIRNPVHLATDRLRARGLRFWAPCCSPRWRPSLTSACPRS